MSIDLKGQSPIAAGVVSLRNPVEILKCLIALPSVNPNSHDLIGPTFYESRMTSWLVNFFDRLDVPCECQEVFPGRHNVVARFTSPGATRTVLMDAHQDTVPVEGMTTPAFQAILKNGRVYGRGACDVKGGMASMLAAFARLVDEAPLGAANVIMSCTVDEEYTAIGARQLAFAWNSEADSDLIIGTLPDLALVAEPTELNVIVAHRGVVRWKIRTRGRACHSSQPEDGVNAIYKMARLLNCLEEYARNLPGTLAPHPLCGSPSMSVGRITGGISVNIVPDECEIEIDRRLAPGEEPVQAMQDVEAYLRARVDVDFEMLPPWVAMEALSDGNNGEAANELLRHISDVAGPRARQGALYGTNASRFAHAGVPSLIFGPGSIQQAHTVDEWIEIDQLHLAQEIYYRFCAGEEAG